MTAVTTHARALCAAACAILLVGWLSQPGNAAEGAQLRLAFGSDAGTRTLTLSQLRAKPATVFATTTPWTDGVQEFRGVALSHLLGPGAAGTTLRLVAQNDYEITMPAPDPDSAFPIIAFERNGAEMSLRDKGPYWLVYPYDSAPEFTDQTILSRSIWQLIEVHVVD